MRSEHLPFVRFLEDGGGAAVAEPPVDSEPAGSASSATSLDDLPFPEVPGLTDGGEISGDGKDRQPADKGSEAGTEDELRQLAADAQGPESLPFDDEKTLNAFLDEYGGRLVQHPRVLQYFAPVVQSQVDRTLAERMAQPENDARYMAETAREEASLAELQAELRKAEEGDIPDGQTIARTYLQGREAIKTAADIAVQRRANSVVESLSQELNQMAGHDVWTPEMRAAYQESEQVFTRLNSARRRDRDGSIVPDEKARARAFPEYLRRTMQIFGAACIEHGRTVERGAKGASDGNRDILRQSNLQRQMQAGVARATPSPASATPTSRPVLSSENLRKGTWRDTAKLMEAAGEHI